MKQFELLFFLLNLVSKLPISVLYFFSDFLYYLACYLIKPGEKVIKENLKNSFPGTSLKEREQIKKNFYQYICDLVVETLKLMNINELEITTRYKLNNLELIEELAREKKNILFVGGHYSNWEWSASLPLWKKGKIAEYKTTGFIYKTSKIKILDFLFKLLRGRFGGIPIEMKKAYRSIFRLSQKPDLFIILTLGDQSPPGDKKIAYWSNFLNQNTPIYLGTEVIAKKFNLAVVFFRPVKIRRGFYQLELELITKDPRNTKKHQITEDYKQKLEKTIKEKPAEWIWAYKRWKHKDKFSEQKSQ